MSWQAGRITREGRQYLIVEPESAAGGTARVDSSPNGLAAIGCGDVARFAGACRRANYQNLEW